MRLVLIYISFFICTCTAVGQAEIEHRHIHGKKGFSQKQNIHILSIPLESFKSDYSLSLAWSDSILMETSRFADSLHALAAVNAGFFNVRDGGSVSYLEIGNERVARRSWKGDPEDFQQSNLNGALNLNRDNNIVIEKAKNSRTYLNSPNEKWVLVTGPILITDGNPEKLLKGSFVESRHPRTCVGITENNLLLITVDGRNKKAMGMSLHELQNFMIKLNCTHAINLDGGGSTTMWAQFNDHQGVINYPSDNGKFDHAGERKVANALLVVKN